MSFIDPDKYNIKFSSLPNIDEREYVSEEENDILTQSEDGLFIKIETEEKEGDGIECKNLCREDAVDSGSFTISNSCTMPLTITGFKMTDPDRFSLFKFPDYTGVKVYHSGIVEQLPFTLEPDQKKQINTFFHPLYHELMSGDSGTILNRIGDQFGSYVKIKPGFPILNCKDGDSCKPQIILTGEFLCEERGLPEWMDNKENFDASDVGSIEFPDIVNEFFLVKKDTLEYSNPNRGYSIQNWYSGLSGAIENYGNLYGTQWIQQYGDWGITGSLTLFFDIVTGIMYRNEHDTKATLFNTEVDKFFEYNDVINFSSSIKKEDIIELEFEGDRYTGFMIDNEAGDNIGIMSDQTVFFKTKNLVDIDIFLCDRGDYEVEQIKSIT